MARLHCGARLATACPHHCEPVLMLTPHGGAGDTEPVTTSAALRLSVKKRLSGLVQAAGKTPSTVLQMLSAR